MKLQYCIIHAFATIKCHSIGRKKKGGSEEGRKEEVQNVRGESLK